MRWRTIQENKIMEQAIDTNLLGEAIVKKLKTIYDPEIPVDIYELGLIYDVMVNEDYEVKILMTLTSPNCPVAETLPREVEEKVKAIEHVKGAEVEITFDPPWSKDLMSEEAKLELGML
jgi:FeS assembly SUF system protein